MTQFVNNVGDSERQERFGEVHYYFRCKIQQDIFTLAMISTYSDPDHILFKESAGTVLVCKYTEDSAPIVIDYRAIISVVGMVPHNFHGLNVEEDWRFVVEKPGLDVARFGGVYDNDSEEGRDNEEGNALGSN